MESRWTVYSHTHIASGRRYVGLTKKTMLFRWNQHVANARAKRGKGCAHFWAAIRLYGRDAFSHEVLEVCDTLEEANAAEERWIEKLGTRDPERGFNLMRGGGHSPHPVKNPWDRPEYREKVLSTSISRLLDPVNRAKSRAVLDSPEFRLRFSEISREIHSRPEVKEKLRLASTGVPRSPETRAKIGAASRGRVTSEETKEKIRLSSTGRRHTSSDRAKMSSLITGMTMDPSLVGTHCVCSVHGLVPKRKGYTHCYECARARQKARYWRLRAGGV